MSHHSDDGLLVAGSDSFWEPGNYKKTTKRIDDGFKLCGDLLQLIQERADIEKGYAKSLKNWAKKWNDLIEKGPEYGTTEAAWKGSLVEADRLCEVHLRIKDNLCNDVTQQIKTWQKDNYHKSMMALKEKKEMEDAFKKAQKPWAKILTKVNKTKADYHAACKNEKTATNQERNSTSDSSLSPDQVKKLQDRVQKSKEEVQKCKEKYELALQEINQYNAKYMEDMTEVFDKCQELEAQRLTFFKEVLFGIHKCLNISQDPVIPQIYEEFYHTVSNADHEKDLKWWSNTHGANMPMNWPMFEDYSEEFRDISRGKGKEPLPAGNITLINQRSVGEDLPGACNGDGDDSTSKNGDIGVQSEPSSKNGTLSKNGTISKYFSLKHKKGNKHPALPIPMDNPATNHKSSKKSFKSSSSDQSTKTDSSKKIEKSEPNNRDATMSTENAINPFDDDEDDDDNADVKENISNGTGKPENNPFEEEEWEEEYGSDALVDNGEAGVPVKALYDYEGTEADELSFKQGETFEKLEDEDEQGWCKGRKDGRVGLYPANYVEPAGI